MADAPVLSGGEGVVIEFLGGIGWGKKKKEKEEEEEAEEGRSNSSSSSCLLYVRGGTCP